MKKLLLPLCLAGTLLATAQSREGKVIYERTIQLQMRFGRMSDEMASQLPRTRTDQFELLFANNQTLWQPLPSANEEANTISTPGGERVIRFGGMGSEDVVYTNLQTGRRVDQRELGSKNYIVEDSIHQLSWKLGEETKTLLGHTARKAVAQRIGTRSIMAMENGEMKRQQQADTSSIVAWFTTDIPVSAGPEFQGQLPGLILELDVNNGRTVYRALELSAKVNASSIKEPKGGKRLSAEDFAKEREKVFEEMRRNAPAGNRTFRIGA